jgi:hypothetical protein
MNKLDQDDYYYNSEGLIVFTEQHHLKGVIVVIINANTALFCQRIIIKRR